MRWIGSVGWAAAIVLIVAGGALFWLASREDERAVYAASDRMVRRHSVRAARFGRVAVLALTGGAVLAGLSGRMFQGAAR
jgi:hypothetical protein